MQAEQRAQAVLPGYLAVHLMRQFSDWGKTTTIILQGGCVFEFKGVFPAGKTAEGYYNLESGGLGFEGHIRLTAVDRITLQNRLHRGRESYAFVFEDKDGQAIFKVFLGRDENGNVFDKQVDIFKKIESDWTAGNRRN